MATTVYADDYEALTGQPIPADDKTVVAKVIGAPVVAPAPAKTEAKVK